MNAEQKISIIIPVLKDSLPLRRLLKEIRKQDFFEIVIVHSHQASLPEPLNVSPHYTVLSAARGRGPQIQAGINSASGDIIWVVHADSNIPKGAHKAIQDIMGSSENAMGCFPIIFNVDRPALRFFAWLSRFESALTSFGDQGFFFRADARRTIPELTHFPLLEDVIMRRYFKTLGRIRKTELPIVTDASRFISRGVWRTQWQNGWVLLRFCCGASPQNLYNEYYQTRD